MSNLTSSDPPVEPNDSTDSSNTKPASGDVNRIQMGEGASAKQVAVGTNITQIYNEADAAYDVHGRANPYLGLAAFTYADRAKYAGRENLVAETVTRITAPAAPIPLLFVTGASGSGKSSFAQAGLLPALEEFYGEFTVKRAVMRPAGDPFAALNDALWRQLRVSKTLQVSENLQGLFVDTPPGQINLLVLDQFEEFFTQSPANARQAFFAWLAQLPAFAQTRTHMIATMRADYLPELFNHPALYDIAKGGVDLRAMNAVELAEAIQQPLRASPYRDTKGFEPSLVQVLAEDASKDAAYLPLLQVTLQEIWRKGWLKREAYTNLTDAIKQRADLVLRFKDFDAANPTIGRTEQEQTALLNLLLDLVDVSPDDDAHRDVRRQRAKVELTGGDPTREQWVKQLSDARLLSVQQDAQDGNRTEVDLIHETLLTNWTRLQSEIAKRRTDLRRRARFEQNLDEWLTEKRSEKYLLEGVRLAEARELEASDDVALRSDDAKAYLRASVTRVEAEQQAELEKERQRAEALQQRSRILRFAIVGVSALALLALLAACFAVEQQGVAVAAANEAHAHLLLTQANQVIEDDPLLGIRLGLEGLAVSNGNAQLQNNLAAPVANLLKEGRVKRFTGPGNGISLESKGVAHIYPSSNRSFFVVAYKDSSAELRRTVDGSLIKSLGSQLADSDQPDGNPAAIFSPDPAAKYLIVKYVQDSDHRAAALFTSMEGKQVNLGEGVSNIEAPSAKYLVIRYANGSFALFDLVEDRLHPLGDGISEVSVSPDPAGRYFVIRYKNGIATLFSGIGDTPIKLGDGISDVSFSSDPGATYVVTTDSESTLTLFTSADGKPVRDWDNAYGIVFSPASGAQNFVVQYNDETSEYYSSPNARPVQLEGPGAISPYFSPDPDAKYLIVQRFSSPLISIYTSADGKPVDLGNTISEIVFSRDAVARYLAANYYDGSSSLYTTADLAPIEHWKEKWVDGISDDLKYLILDPVPMAVSGRELIRIADGSTVNLGNETYAILFGPAPIKYFVAQNADTSYTLFSTENDEPHSLAKFDQGLSEFRYDTEVQHLLTLYLDGSAFLVDISLLDAMTKEQDTPQKLISLACQALFVPNKYNFDDHTLMPFLNGNPPEACN